MKEITKVLLPKNPIEIVEKEIKKVLRAKSPVTVLDLGYGSGNHWRIIDPRIVSEVNLTVVDAKENDGSFQYPAIKPNKIINGLLPGLLNDLINESYDIVIAFDLLEHLSMEDGYLMLYQMQRLSSVSALVFTPNGHVWQPPISTNPFQAHISGWKPGQFRALGWLETKGGRGFKWFYGPMAQPRFLPESKLMAALRAPIDKLVTWLFPNLSFSFTAIFRVKKMKEIHRKFLMS